MTSGGYPEVRLPSLTEGGGEPEDWSLRHYVVVMRRRWKAVGITALLATALVGLYQHRRPVSFTASTLVQKTTAQSPLQAPSLGLNQTGGEAVVAAEMQTILTRSILGPAVDSGGLRLRVSNGGSSSAQMFAVVSLSRSIRPGPYRLVARQDSLLLLDVTSGHRVAWGSTESGDVRGSGVHLVLRVPGSLSPGTGIGLVVVSREEAIGRLQRRLVLDPVSATSMVWIRYSSTEPDHAAEVANEVADAYQRTEMQRSRVAAVSQREFLGQRLAAVNDSLRAAQDVVLDFQARGQTLDPTAEGQTLSKMLLDEQQNLRELDTKEQTLRNLMGEFRADSTRQSDDEPLRQMMILSQDLFPSASGLYSQLESYRAQKAQLTASPIVGAASGSPQVQALDSMIAETKDEMRAVAQQTLGIIVNQRKISEARVAELKSQVQQVPEKTTAYARLQQRVTAIENTYNMLAEKYYEAQIAEASDVGDVQVLESAVPPTEPDPAHTARNILLGAVAGLLLGFGLALAIEHFDRTLRDTNDAIRRTGLEPLGLLAKSPATFNGAGRLVTATESAMGEAFQMAAANLRFIQTGPIRSLLITSAGPQDGKSFVAANLSVALAAGGKRVLLVDSDLRRPTQHETFGTDRAPGLSEAVVRGTLPLPVQETKVPGLRLLTAGSALPNPTQVLSSEQFLELLTKQIQEFDVVVIDSAPALLATEVSVLAKSVDATILVTRLEVTDAQAATEAVLQLKRAGASLVGQVINGLNTRTLGGYYGYAAGKRYYGRA